MRLLLIATAGFAARRTLSRRFSRPSSTMRGAVALLALLALAAGVAPSAAATRSMAHTGTPTRSAARTETPTRSVARTPSATHKRK